MAFVQNTRKETIKVGYKNHRIKLKLTGICLIYVLTPFQIQQSALIRSLSQFPQSSSTNLKINGVFSPHCLVRHLHSMFSTPHPQQKSPPFSNTSYHAP